MSLHDFVPCRPIWRQNEMTNGIPADLIASAYKAGSLINTTANSVDVEPTGRNGAEAEQAFGDCHSANPEPRLGPSCGPAASTSASGALSRHLAPNIIPHNRNAGG
jgi:hypothetical protein